MSKKTKTTSSGTSSGTSTTTPTAPGYLRDQVESQSDLINSLRGRSGSDFVAGASDLQKSAFDLIAERSGIGQSGGKGAITPISEGSGQPGQGGANGFDLGMGIAGQVAGAGPNQVQDRGGYNPAIFGGAQTGGNYAPVEAAQVGAGGNVDAASLLDNFERYQSPYTEQVVDATMADFDANAGRTRAAQNAQAAANGSFGGSRFGVREAITEGELARGRATTGATLRDAGFNTAAQLSGQDADRRQSASTANASFANQRALTQAGLDQSTNLFNREQDYTNDRYNTSLLQQAGLAGADAINTADRYNLDAGRQTDQFNAGLQESGLNRQLSAAGLLGNLQGGSDDSSRADLAQLLGAGGVQQGLNQQEAGSDLALASLLSQLTGAIPGQYVTGQTSSYTGQNNGTSTTRESDPFGAAMNVGGAALSFFSDARLKTDIRADGKIAGHNAYTYHMAGDPPGKRQRGVLAHEVALTRPDAVTMDPSGYQKVNYGAL